MKNSLVVALLALLLSCGCGEEVLLDGDIKAAKVEKETEYYAPLVLEQGSVSRLVLNGEEKEFSQGIYTIDDAGFYEMILDDSDPVLFVLLNPERVYDNRVFAEWGLKEWVPEDPILNENTAAELELISPANYAEGIAVPYVARIKEWEPFNTEYVLCSEGSETFKMKRGVASSSVVLSDGQLSVKVGKQSLSKILNKLEGASMVLNSEINEPYSVPRNTVVRISENVNVTPNGSLSFGEGSIVLIDEGVNIYSSGSIDFNGTAENPVLVTCSDPEKYFGGFILNGSSAVVTASNAFFSRFSHNVGGEFSYGHAQHQALFKSTRSDLHFENCYFFDSPGQVIHPEGAEVTLENCIVQRTKTTGQFNRGSAVINNCYFSDFPDDTRIYQDSDNDALYLNDIDVTISNSVFMYTKDDGVDSGGNKGGEISIDNCVFEACFHEALALSSVDPAEKHHSITSCLITKCQQGVELGFSSPNHAVVVEDCTFADNYIGVRFGDCYTRPVDGTLEVKNATFSGNFKDSWNMVRLFWKPSVENLTISNSTFN